RYAGEHLEDPAPVAFGVEDTAHLVAARAVAIEAPVLELDPRAVLAFGNEAKLDLGAEVRIVLPVGGDVPAQYQPRVRLPRQHAPPIACASVFAALVPPPPDARLDHRVHRLRLSDLVVREWPPRAHLLGEYPPRDCGRCLDAHDLPHAVGISTCGHRLLRHHRVLSLAASRSAAVLKAASVSSQKPSSHLRTSSRPVVSTAYSRLVPSARWVTSRACLSTLRCCDTAGRLTSIPLAISPTERAPARSRLNTARRVGSP